MFSALLSLPKDRMEARLVADALDGVARALREWPTDAWKQVRQTTDPSSSPAPLAETATAGLLERLVGYVAPVTGDTRAKKEALRSAEASAAVLRSLWPSSRTLTVALPPTEPAGRNLATSAA